MSHGFMTFWCKYESTCKLVNYRGFPFLSVNIHASDLFCFTGWHIASWVDIFALYQLDKMITL